VLATIGGLAITLGAVAVVIDVRPAHHEGKRLGDVALAAPPRIRAHATTDEITLRWTPAPGGAARYEVTRNGQVVVASQRSTRFVDRNVEPLGSYIYEVRTVGDDGDTSASTRTVVRVPQPDPATARVEGLYTVRLDERSQHGFRQLFPERTAEFIFEPACLLGRCTVDWTYVDHPGIATEATYRGGAYEGRTDGQLDIPCGSQLPTTTLTLAFRVTRGDVTGGDWIASKLEGSLREDTPPQFGCVHSTVSYDFTATPLPPTAANVFRVTNEECRFDGTGFLTRDSGYVVTNAHVVAGATHPVVNLNGRTVTATVVAFSPDVDLAVLDVGPVDRAAGFQLSPSTTTLGRYPAFGFPNGRSLSQYEVDLTRSLTRGFSLTGSPERTDGYAFRGNVHHGDSGGPVVSGTTVLGIVTSGIAGRSGYAVGSAEAEALIRTADRSTPVPTGACYRG
jgi:hypothetical protein